MIELERARTLSRMIAGFVHQFRTPLHIIGSASAHVAEDPQLPATFKAELALIQRSTERLNTSVTNLLGFAKGEPSPWMQGSLNDPLNKVVDFLKDECRKRNVRLDLQENASLPPVRMQPALLEEAFLNFAMDSLEAMPGGGVLRLSTQSAPDQSGVRVCINDTGMGMTPNMLKRVGQAFATGKKTGIGLGVYFANEILKRHHARAHYESKPGEWTMLTLTFPAAA